VDPVKRDCFSFDSECDGVCKCGEGLYIRSDRACTLCDSIIYAESFRLENSSVQLCLVQNRDLIVLVEIVFGDGTPTSSSRTLKVTRKLPVRRSIHANLVP
jgi:hypothetical protein